VPKKNRAASARDAIVTSTKRRVGPTNGKHDDSRAKFKIGDVARVNDRAPGDYAERLGIVTEVGPGGSEYRVEFEDSRRPTTRYLKSWWLDKA
jgi:hypothetical protein